MNDGSLQSTIEEKKTKVKPFLLPVTSLALALGAVYMWGKSKGKTYLVVSSTEEEPHTNVKVVGKIK